MTEAEFWRRLEEQPNGCLFWTGAFKENGYGRAWFQGQDWYAHRLAFFLKHGYLPKRPRVVSHTCEGPNNPGWRACCNPAHLVDARQAENIKHGYANGAQRGRNFGPRSERTGKLASLQ